MRPARRPTTSSGCDVILGPGRERRPGTGRRGTRLPGVSELVDGGQRSGSALTPGGGRPAVEASKAHQADMCPASPAAPVGVQEARISRSAMDGGPASSPNRVEVVWVTVPASAVCSAACPASASVSQLQPTSGSSGSVARSGSSSAVT